MAQALHIGPHTATVEPREFNRTANAAAELSLAISASLFVALCARVTLPLPFTPVPLTLQNFGVLLVGMVLGSRRGFAAMSLYLIEGASGLPVFNPAGPGGLAQLLGPTGGYLMAYPAVAWVAGRVMERGKKIYTTALTAGAAAEVILFAAGVAWLMAATVSPFAKAAAFGLYPFVPAEALKISAAAALAIAWRRVRRIG